MQPKTQKTDELESTFNVLADKWERDTAILRRIERKGGLWYHALETISGIPTPSGVAKLKTKGWHTVNVKEANAAWLQWGKEQGYKW